MKKSDKVRLEAGAFPLYTQGVALDNIAKQIGVAYQTIRAWRKTYKWDKRKKEIDQKLQDQQKQVIINFNKKKIPLIMSLIVKTIKDIQLSDKGNVKDFMMLYDKFEQLTAQENVLPEYLEEQCQERFNELVSAIREGKGIEWGGGGKPSFDTDEEHYKKSKKQKKEIEEEPEEEIEEQEEELEDIPKVKKKKKIQPEPFDEDLEGNQEKEPIYGYIATGSHNPIKKQRFK